MTLDARILPVAPPAAVRAFAVLLARSRNMLPLHYRVAVAYRTGERFILDPTRGVEAGWDDGAHLRIITDESSLIAFLLGELDPNKSDTTFIWTGAERALETLRCILSTPTNLLGLRIGQSKKEFLQ